MHIECNKCWTKNIWGITGAAGTGKTLLIYDIAKELCKTGKCCVVHSGILCDGHNKLANKIANLYVYDAKTVGTLDLNEYDFFIVDETQRLYDSTLEKILDMNRQRQKICIFSYDRFQTLSYREKSGIFLKNLKVLKDSLKKA